MKPATTHHTIIIGGGPAGLFAAAHLKSKDVLLLEKNFLPGRKLMISGNGQCNFTHSGKIQDFSKHYGDNFPFLAHALKSYTNTEVIDFFEHRGIKTITDKNGKVFPRSLKAEDILQVLLQEMSRKKIETISGEPVQKVSRFQDQFKVFTAYKNFTCKNLIIATGGLSYPSTGSTGDGYRLAAMLGHCILPGKPALCPVIPKNYPFAALSGISLSSAKVSLFREGKLINEHSGDIGFTHTGLSGPGIIDFSRYILPDDILKINLAGISLPEIEKRFITQSQHGSTTLISFLRQQSMVKSLALAVLELIPLSPEKPLAEVSKVQRKRLLSDCCAYPFEVESLAGFKKAMVTAGGVALNEINHLTMESVITKGLYFAGEVMDVDGDTGGYNIQAAFSTAWLAAKSINEAEEII